MAHVAIPDRYAHVIDATSNSSTPLKYKPDGALCIAFQTFVLHRDRTQLDVLKEILENYEPTKQEILWIVFHDFRLMSNARAYTEDEIVFAATEFLLEIVRNSVAHRSNFALWYDMLCRLNSFLMETNTDITQVSKSYHIQRMIQTLTLSDPLDAVDATNVGEFFGRFIEHFHRLGGDKICDRTYRICAILTNIELF